MVTDDGMLCVALPPQHWFQTTGLVTETLTIILTLSHLLSGYCHVELHPQFSRISTLNRLLENNEQDVISGQTNPQTRH